MSVLMAASFVAWLDDMYGFEALSEYCFGQRTFDEAFGTDFADLRFDKNVIDERRVAYTFWSGASSLNLSAIVAPDGMATVAIVSGSSPAAEGAAGFAAGLIGLIFLIVMPVLYHLLPLTCNSEHRNISH